MSDSTTSGKSAAEIFGSDRMWGLKDVPLLEPVSWWPQTSGWYVLGLVLLIFGVWLGWKFRHYYKSNQYRRDGLQQLSRMKLDFKERSNLPGLLRYSALQTVPRKEVAGLDNVNWITWLNESAGKELFLPEDCKTFEMLSYSNPENLKIDDDQIKQLINASESWMRLHRASI